MLFPTAICTVPISEAQKRATKKYKDKVYKRITLLIRNEDYLKLETLLERSGESKNGFINRAIQNQIEKEMIKYDNEN